MKYCPCGKHWAMATAKLLDASIYADVQLTLSPAEALALGSVLRRVGGSTTTSSRKYIERIAQALYRIGRFPTQKDVNLQGDLVFKDIDKDE